MGVVRQIQLCSNMLRGRNGKSKHVPECGPWKAVLYTNQEMIPARNTIDTHAQDFVVNEELLLTIWKHSHNAFAYPTILKVLDVFSLSAVIRHPDAPTNSSPIVQTRVSSPRTAPDTPVAGIISWSVDSRMSVQLSTRLQRLFCYCVLQCCFNSSVCIEKWMLIKLKHSHVSRAECMTKSQYKDW